MENYQNKIEKQFIFILIKFFTFNEKTGYINIPEYTDEIEYNKAINKFFSSMLFKDFIKPFQEFLPNLEKIKKEYLIKYSENLYNENNIFSQKEIINLNLSFINKINKNEIESLKHNEIILSLTSLKKYFPSPIIYSLLLTKNNDFPFLGKGGSGRVFILNKKIVAKKLNQFDVKALIKSKKNLDIFEKRKIDSIIEKQNYINKTKTIFDEFLHEEFIGKYVGNYLRLKLGIPNFVITYGCLNSCDKLLLKTAYEQEDVNVICNDDKTKDFESILLLENLESTEEYESVSLRKFLKKDGRLTQLIFEHIYMQILYSSYTAYKIFGFCHNDLHVGNIMLKIYKNDKKINYDFHTYTIVIKTKYIPIIYDFGFSSCFVDDKYFFTDYFNFVYKTFIRDFYKFVYSSYANIRMNKNMDKIELDKLSIWIKKSSILTGFVFDKIKLKHSISFVKKNIIPNYNVYRKLSEEVPIMEYLFPKGLFNALGGNKLLTKEETEKLKKIENEKISIDKNVDKKIIPTFVLKRKQGELYSKIIDKMIKG